MVECNCTNIRIQELVGFPEMNVNSMGGVVTRGIITIVSPEILITLKKAGFFETPLIFFSEDNEEFLKAQDARRQTSGKISCKNMVFSENITHIFQLPNMNFRYIPSIQTSKEGLKKQLREYFFIDTGKRERNC